MRGPGALSLEQLMVLLTVVDAGSFTAAAKRLGRATSAVTYAIDALEDQLGMPLFDRGATRKPRLTPEGEAIVSEARAVADSVEALRARAKGLREKLEPEVSLAVDALFPYDWLMPVLSRLHATYPTVPVRLIVETLGGVERAVRGGTVGLGLAGRMHTNANGLRQLDIVGVPMIPVASPRHPLADAAGLNLRAKDFVQIVLSERPDGEKKDYGVVSINHWRVSDIAMKHRLLIEGLGWGGMPEPMVSADLESGKLVHLDLRDWRGGVYPMGVVHLADNPPGPAGQSLIESLMALPASLAGHADLAPRTTKTAARPAKRRLRS